MWHHNSQQLMNLSYTIRNKYHVPLICLMLSLHWAIHSVLKRMKWTANNYNHATYLLIMHVDWKLFETLTWYFIIILSPFNREKLHHWFMNATEGLQKNTISCTLLNVFKQTCHLHLHIRWSYLENIFSSFLSSTLSGKTFPTHRAVSPSGLRGL